MRALKLHCFRSVAPTDLSRGCKTRVRMRAPRVKSRRDDRTDDLPSLRDSDSQFTPIPVVSPPAKFCRAFGSNECATSKLARRAIIFQCSTVRKAILAPTGFENVPWDRTHCKCFETVPSWDMPPRFAFDREDCACPNDNELETDGSSSKPRCWRTVGSHLACSGCHS